MRKRKSKKANFSQEVGEKTNRVSTKAGIIFEKLSNRSGKILERLRGGPEVCLF